jgi:DNA-binding transcriptional ArsR family regulator
MSDTETDPPGESITECEECISPAEAFSVVGNETRLEILEALWRVERPVSFSRLREEVGMRDSAQFNYHLSQLTGQFVRKTDDGYEFRQPGREVIRAVLSGTLNRDPVIDPFPVRGECVDCGTGLHAEYREERVRVFCPACGRQHGAFDFPPGGLADRTHEEVMDAFNQRARHLSCLSADGVCPACNGRMTAELERDPEAHPEFETIVHHECDRCGNHIPSSIGLVLLDDAEVVAFYRDHGIDLNAVPFWTLAWCVSDEYTTVLDTDPWRVEVAVPVADEQLVVTLDEELTVVETERRERAVA